MNFVVVTSLPTAAFQLVYFAQTQGLKFSHVVIIGQDSASYDLFREYSQINSFGLYFVSDPNSAEAVELLKSLRPGVIQVITDKIIRKQVLELPTHGVVNTHAAWLPEYRGSDTPWWAVLEGGKLGVCVHFVNEGVDTGDLILRKELRLQHGDNSKSILTRAHYELKWQTTTEALIAVRDGTAKRTPQRKEDGKQYFCMHPKLVEVVDQVLAKL